jgi:hypothetical protein
MVATSEPNLPLDESRHFIRASPPRDQQSIGASSSRSQMSQCLSALCKDDEKADQGGR